VILTKAYQKREDLTKPYRSLGEELRFSIYYCKADPPLKKTKKIGGAFTIVDVTLLYCCKQPTTLHVLGCRVYPKSMQLADSWFRSAARPVANLGRVAGNLFCGTPRSAQP